jgi:hypothetical protein
LTQEKDDEKYPGDCKNCKRKLKIAPTLEALNLLKETATASFLKQLKRIFGWALTLSTQINSYGR